MFISKAEKEELRISVRTLQAKVKELDGLMAGLNERFDRLAAYAIKKTKRVQELESAMNIKAEKPDDIDSMFDSIFRSHKSAEAPWGYKKNGVPRMRPGPNSVHPHEVKK